MLAEQSDPSQPVSTDTMMMQEDVDFLKAENKKRTDEIAGLKADILQRSEETKFLKASLEKLEKNEEVKHIKAALEKLGNTFEGFKSATGNIKIDKGVKCNDKEASMLKPAVWQGAKDKIPFKEFSDGILNWAAAIAEGALQQIEAAGRGELEKDELDENANIVTNKLYSVLVQCTTLEARTIVRSVKRGEGFEAWHELCNFYDPRTATDELAEHAKITHPSKRAKDYVEAQVMLNEWITNLNDYEARFDKIADKTKMAALKNLMPIELFNKDFRGRKFKDFEEMALQIKTFLADKPITVSTTKEKKEPATNEVNEMITEQLNALFFSKGKGDKGGGKGYGKHFGGSKGYQQYPQWETAASGGYTGYPSWGYKGAGKGGDYYGKGAGKDKGGSMKGETKGKGKGKGPCFGCGELGHQAWQCPNKGKGKSNWGWQRPMYGFGDESQEGEKQEEEKEEEEEEEDNEGDMMAYQLEVDEDCECKICGTEPDEMFPIHFDRESSPKEGKP